MNGLSFAPEGLPTDGRAASVTATPDRKSTGHRGPPADGKAFSEIVSSLSRPPEAAPADGGTEDAAVSSQPPARPLLLGAMTRSPEAMGDGMTAPPASPDQRPVFVEGDTTSPVRAGALPTGSSDGGTLPSLAGSAAPAAAALPPATVAGTAAATDAASPEVTPVPAARARSETAGSPLLLRVPQHTGDRRAPDAATPSAIGSGVRLPRDLDATAGDRRVENEPAAPVTAAAALGASSPAVAATAAAAVTVVATTDMSIPAPSAAFLPIPHSAMVEVPTAPVSPEPTGRQTANPAAEAVQAPPGTAAHAKAGTEPVPAPASAPVAGTTVAPGAVAPQPAVFDVTSVPTAATEATTVAAPAVASLVGRVAVHVREMRTHFAPVTPRSAMIPGEPATLTARVPAGEATPAESAPSDGRSPKTTVSASSTSPSSTSPSSTSSRSNAPPSPVGRGTGGEAAGAAALNPGTTAVPGGSSSVGATTAPAMPSPVPGVAPPPVGADAVGPPATSPEADSLDATAAATRAAQTVDRGAEPGNASAAKAEPAPRQPDTAPAVFREPRTEGAAEARRELRADPVALEERGPAAPTAAAGGGATTDASLRSLAQDIGRAARTISGEAPAAPTSDIGTSRPIATRRDVEIELKSPDFGVVRLRMRLTGTSLELRLRTDDAATLTLLAERRGDLEQAIAEFGVDAKVVDVSRVSQPSSTATPFAAHGQGPTGDTGRGADGQRFEQQPSPERNDRRPSSQPPTDGSTSDDDAPTRPGTRAGTLFV
jgi:hypothetical protein